MKTKIDLEVFQEDIDSVINQAIKSLTEKTIKKLVEEKIPEVIDGVIHDKVAEWIDKKLDNITFQIGGCGDVKEISLQEKIEKAFVQYLSEDVRKTDGRKKEYYDDKVCKRIDYILLKIAEPVLNNKIKVEIDDAVKKVKETLSKNSQKYIQEKIREIMQFTFLK